MLEEFILGQLEEIECRKEDLKRQLNDLVNQEKEDNEEISKLLKEQDLGFELFSPRSANHSVREQVDTIKNHIEELRVRQTQIRGDLEQNTVNENRYQEMLLEARQRESDPSLPGQMNEKDAEGVEPEATEENAGGFDQISIEEAAIESEDSQMVTAEAENTALDEETALTALKKEHIQQLETVLKRVDQCIDLSHRDKIKCRNELKNLRYYMKALISKNQ